MIRAITIATLAYCASAARDIDCETCQTIVHDLGKRMVASPKSLKVNNHKRAMLRDDLMESQCAPDKFGEYAEKAEISTNEMVQACEKILPALEERLEEELGDTNTDELRASLCKAKEGKAHKKKKKRRTKKQGYCDTLWASDDMPEQRESPAMRNRREGAEWLSEKKKEEGVVALSSGLMYKVMTKGSGEIHPTKDDDVTVHYAGTLTDGTEFDSSYSRGDPSSFGVSQVISGWTEALQLMKRGDVWEVYIPGDLAYGTRGSPPKIGPNAVLVFQVELLGIRNVDDSNTDTKREEEASAGTPEAAGGEGPTGTEEKTEL